MGSIFSAIAAALQLALGLFKRKERSEAEEVGGLKQREANQGATIEAQARQLDAAVNHRPDETGKAMREGRF